MAGVGASEGIGEDELPFRSGDTVFLRLNLQPSDGPGPDLLRGTSGEVTEVRSSDDTVKVRFGSILVRCRTDWLESVPEQIIVLTDTSPSTCAESDHDDWRAAAPVPKAPPVATAGTRQVKPAKKSAPKPKQPDHPPPGYYPAKGSGPRVQPYPIGARPPSLNDPQLPRVIGFTPPPPAVAAPPQLHRYHRNYSVIHM